MLFLEVISESTEAIDRGKKRRIYRREGVAHLWLLTPTARTLEVYRLTDGAWTEVDTYEGDARLRAQPFDAIELDLAVLWAKQGCPHFIAAGGRGTTAAASEG